MSLVSYAPKGEIFCTIDSLKTRVVIAAAIQVLGYYEVWTIIFDEFNLIMNDNLSTILQTMDNKKGTKRKKTAPNEKKRKRSIARVGKPSIAHENDMKAQQDGNEYGQDIPMQHATR